MLIFDKDCVHRSGSGTSGRYIVDNELDRIGFSHWRRLKCYETSQSHSLAEALVSNLHPALIVKSRCLYSIYSFISEVL